MKTCIACLALACVLLSGCSRSSAPLVEKEGGPLNAPFENLVVPPEQEAEIRALVEQLVFAESEAQNRPVLAPHGRKEDDKHLFDAENNRLFYDPSRSGGGPKDPEEYRQRFETCQAAFEKLTEFKIAAFPVLIEHLDDKQQSINFRNHFLGNSVGNACHWILYYQLQDEPDNYSEYGESRKGSDGKKHVKPYWEGTPFDEAGGPKKWLEANKRLSYRQMQIKCLQWLLDKEKAIGAPDAESYALNIRPLETRILERKQQAGE